MPHPETQQMPYTSPNKQNKTKKRSKWIQKEKPLVITKCPAKEHLANTIIEVHISVSRSFLSLQQLRRGRKEGMKKVLQKGISLQKWQLFSANQKTLALRQSLTHHSVRGNRIPLWSYLDTDPLVLPLNYTIFSEQDLGPLFLSFKKRTELS